MVHAREQTHTVLYKGSEPPMSSMLDAMAETYKTDLVSLEELHRMLHEETKGKELSGVVRQMRDEGW